MAMDRATLRKICKDTGLYTTASLNDKLYLHYKGFAKIENLEDYTGLKALWLEGNGLAKIEGLAQQVLMRSLYLQENIIERIEGMDSLTELDSLNLSKNFITKIENLSHMTKLTSLNLANNKISSLEGMEQVTAILSLQTLDLQHNKIDDEGVVDILAQMPDLRVLYLMGNPCVKKIKHYRRTIVSRCKNLKYLDDRPVFDEERRRTDAWAAAFETSGIDAAMEAERLELQKIRKEKDDADERNYKAFEQLMLEGREIRRLKEAAAAAAAAAADSDARVQNSTENVKVNPFTGEAILHVPEAEELRIAREDRWNEARTAAQSATPSSALCSTLPTPPPLASCDTDNRYTSAPAPPVVPSAGVKAWTKVAIEEEDSENTPPALSGATAAVQQASAPPLPPTDMNALD